MAWTPPDLSRVCPMNSDLTACTNTGYVYLMLLAQLFGDSIDDRIERNDQSRNQGSIIDSIKQRRLFESANGLFEGIRKHGRIPRRKEKKHNRAKERGDEEFDFIIVGAGSAGCVLANRLSEVAEWKILLLEAGPEEPEVASVPGLAPALAGSSIDWSYSTVPDGRTCTAQLGGSCFWPRGKVMGGSSVLNYMVYMRGNKRDYDEWAELGNDGWSYRDVLPYFMKSENNRDLESLNRLYHGIGGYLNVEKLPYRDKNSAMLIEGFVEMGLPITDFNGRSQVGVAEIQTTSKDGQRFSSNVAFLRPIRHKRPNLTIKTEAEVTKILIDPKAKTANGVKYFKDRNYKSAIATKEVIISAGAINSPKLLLLSGVGPRTDLEKLNIDVVADLKVGKNLQEHPTAEGVVLSLSNWMSTAVSETEMTRQIYKYKNSTRKNGPLASTGSTITSAFPYNLNLNEALDVPNIQYLFPPKTLKDFFKYPTLYTATQIFPLSYYDSMSIFTALLKPESRGQITLNESDPIFGHPQINPNFYSVQNDVDTMIEGIKFLFSLENTASFVKNGAKFVKQPLEACKDEEWGSDEYWTCMLFSYTSSSFHPVGTCKMGPAWDSTAVVDPSLKVYGIKHLRVADASIMPLIVRGNTNAPTIMIGEKASDLVKSDWT